MIGVSYTGKADAHLETEKQVLVRGRARNYDLSIWQDNLEALYLLEGVRNRARDGKIKVIHTVSTVRPGRTVSIGTIG